MSEARSCYEADFVRWSEEQATAIRAAAASRTNLPLDWDNLAEEIESLGRSVRAELRNRLATVIEHLLKLRLSAAEEPRRGWIETVERERIEIEALLDENPSLRATLADALETADRKGRKLARLGLERHGEWSAEMDEASAASRLTDRQVIGPWLPEQPR